MRSIAPCFDALSYLCEYLLELLELSQSIWFSFYPYAFIPVFFWGSIQNVPKKATKNGIALKEYTVSEGYFSLNDFWHSNASPAWRSKTPTTFYPLKKARNFRDGDYSFTSPLLDLLQSTKIWVNHLEQKA